MLSSIERDFVRTERPLYGHLVTLIEAAIAKGELPSGARVPPERTLAQHLRISRTTVVSAYRELESRGLLRGYVGRGTFVCAAPEPEGTPFAWRGKIAAAALRWSDSTLRDIVRHSSDARLLSLAAGEPAIDKFPNEAFQDAVAHVLRADPAAAWRHGPTEGQPALREAIAERYRVPRDTVLILSGAQQGLDLLARCLIDPGDAVVMDRPGYLGAIQSFRAAGAKLVGWDVVRADIDELEDLLVRYRPKLIYTNPTFQNPTGTTLPIRTRRELLMLARRYRVPVIEDATYCDLSLGAAPPPGLHTLDEAGDVVIRVNSFSKVLAPGLRLGWIGAARPIIEQLALMKQQIDPHTQNLIQLVVARLIDTGMFDRHLATLRGEHRRRRDALAKALQRAVPPGALRFSLPEGGLFLWCRVPPEVSARDIQERALRDGVSVVTGEPFYTDDAGTHELRLCFSARPPEVLAAAAKTVAAAVAAAARVAAPAPALRRLV